MKRIFLVACLLLTICSHCLAWHQANGGFSFIEADVTRTTRNG